MSLLRRRRQRGEENSEGSGAKEKTRWLGAGCRAHNGGMAAATTLLNACIKKEKGRADRKMKFPYMEAQYSYIQKGTSSEWFRSTDLGVMGPARFHCATLLCTESLCSILGVWINRTA